MKPFLMLALFLSGCATFTATNDAIPVQPETCVGANCGAAPTVLEDPVTTETEDFTFVSHGDTLHGELLRPAGVEGPLPAVVILHDLGPFSRDGLVRDNFGVQLPVEVPIYRSLAEDLASVGFAVLIYDKRTCVEGGRVFCTYPRTYLKAIESNQNAVVDDAEAAIKALQSRRDVRTDFLGLVGHGQGAAIALELERRKVPISAIAALNLSAATPTAMVLHQLKATEQALQARIQAEQSADTDEMRLQLKRVQDSLAQAEAVFTKTNGEFGGVNAQVWSQLDALHNHALAQAKTGTAPLMVLVGSMDLNAPDDDEEKLRKLLGERPFWVSLDGVSHDLVELTGDATMLSEDVSQTVAEFLKSPGK